MIAAWVMVLPFLGTSLIANGVMPTVASNGVIMLVICSGGAMVEMAFDPVTMEPVTDEDGDGSKKSTPEYCVWAAAHPQAHIPPLAALPVVASGFTVEAHQLVETVLRIAEATGLPPATGPPVMF